MQASWGMMIPNYETGGFHTMQDYLSTIVLAEEYAKEFDVPTGSIVPATLFHRLDEPRVRKIVDRWIDYLAIGILQHRRRGRPRMRAAGRWHLP